ncbi:MAG TPA: thioredoxin family protein [Bacteroidia bacterium]|nr:thioredoxin family protein [Bacteroidia bacterium]
MEPVTIPSDALSYSDYRSLIKKLLSKNLTTGNTVTESYVEFTRLNEYRMDRLENKVELKEELVQKVSQLQRPEVWLVLSEAWCGDSAQTLPVFDKIARLSSGTIQLLITGRDNHPELMKRFLTDGSRSVPVLLRVNKQSGQLISRWGPRPKPAQEIMLKWKHADGAISKEDFQKELHLWYAVDQTMTLQKELIEIW